MTDYKLVPLEPTAEMVVAAEDAYMPFGDMDLALRMALLAAPAVQGEPVGYVSQDFLDGKWNMDHIAKSDEGQISRTIPVFAKPPQPVDQQPAPDVSELVEFCEAKLHHLPVEDQHALTLILSAHREQQGGALAQSGRGGDAGNQETDM